MLCVHAYIIICFFVFFPSLRTYTNNYSIFLPVHRYLTKGYYARKLINQGAKTATSTGVSLLFCCHYIYPRHHPRHVYGLEPPAASINPLRAPLASAPLDPGRGLGRLSHLCRHLWNTIDEYNGK